MKQNYNGKIAREESKPIKKPFNGWSLFFWLLSLIISLLPIFLNMINYYDEVKTIDKVFVFKCFTEYDGLWIFTTFILFIIFDWLGLWLHNRYKISTFLLVFVIGASIIAGVTEITWLVLRFVKFNNPEVHYNWVCCLGAIEVALTILFATPVRISTLKEGEQK